MEEHEGAERMSPVEPELFDAIREDLKRDFAEVSDKARVEWERKSIERDFARAEGYKDLAERLSGVLYYLQLGCIAVSLLIIFAQLYGGRIDLMARLRALELKVNDAVS